MVWLLFILHHFTRPQRRPARTPARRQPSLGRGWAHLPRGRATNKATTPPAYDTSENLLHPSCETALRHKRPHRR